MFVNPSSAWGTALTFRNSFNWEQQPVAIVSVFPRRETHSVLVLRLAYPCYKCVFDFLRESLAGSDIGMGMVALGGSIGGESAGGGGVVALAVEVIFDGGWWWIVVDSDGM